MAADKFATYTPGIGSPPADAEAVVADVAFSSPATCLNVNVSGNVSVVMLSGATVVVYIAAGIWFPCRSTKVNSSGTDAGVTQIVAGRG